MDQLGEPHAWGWVRANRRTLKTEQGAAWSSFLPFDFSAKEQHGHRLHAA